MIGGAVDVHITDISGAVPSIKSGKIGFSVQSLTNQLPRSEGGDRRLRHLRVGALYQTAMRRMTEDIFAGKLASVVSAAGAASAGFDPLDAGNVAAGALTLASRG